MQNIIYKFGLKKVGLILGVVLVAVFAVTLAVLPRQTTISRADGCTAYSQPQFNPFPVKLNGDVGYDCTDAPVLSAGNQGDANWAYSVNSVAGQDISMRIWAHNGAAVNSGAVMSGVNISTSISDSADGTSHTITTTLSANNAASKTGSVTVYTPVGARLELISGQKDIYLGDFEPCFEFARTFLFTLRVVAPVVQNPTGSISGQIHADNQQCRVYGSLNWQTDNVSTYPIVTVKDVTDNSSENILFSGNDGSNSDFGSEWLTQGNDYVFSLYTDNSLSKQLASTGRLNVPRLNCGTTPVSEPKVISFNVDFGQCIGNQNQINSYISWNTQDFSNITIKIKPDVGDIADYSYSNSGNREQVDWLIPGHSYTFTFYNNNSLVHTEYVSVPSRNCGVTPISYTTLYCFENSHISPLYVGDDITFSAAGGDGVYQWTSSGNSTGQNGVNYFVRFNQAGTQTATVRSGDGQTANCSVYLSQRVTPTPTPTSYPTPTPTNNNPVCPSGNAILSPSVINQGETSIASAPYGWSNGYFVSNNLNLVTVSGNRIIAGYSSIGSSTITGKGWDVVTSNGVAHNCDLGYAGITVNRPSVNACIQRDFNTNTSGFYVNGSKVNSLQPNQEYSIKCDYNLPGSIYITLQGNGSQPCNIDRYEGSAAVFNCHAPSNPGTYSVSCEMAANPAIENSCRSSNPIGSYTVSQPQTPVCPSGQSVTVSPNTIYVGNTVSAYAPNGWYGGSFSSSNSNIASVSGSTVTGNSQGYASISGSGFSVQTQNGLATNCSLNPGSITVQTQQPTSFTATATATAYASASASCPNGTTASATASASATATATSSISQSDAQSRAYNQALSQAQVQANAQAQANAQVNCPNTPPVCPAGQSVTVTPSVINVGQTAVAYAPFGWSGGNFNSSNSNIASVSGSTVTGNSQGYASISGSGFSVQTQNGLATNCSLNPATITVNQNIQQLTCQTLTPSVQSGQTAVFAAFGGTGSYAWSASGANVTSGTGSQFSTSYPSGTNGSRTVVVTSGNQTANCQVQVTTPPPVCVMNTSNVLSNGAITQVGELFSTNITYSASGNNSIKIVYTDPVSGQDVEFVSPTSVLSGSKVFSNIIPNKTYVFKMIDTSSCGGVIATLVVRKDVSQNQCIANTNFALNYSAPAQNGSTYSTNLTWSSTSGSSQSAAHQIRITQITQDSSGENTLLVGESSGSRQVTGLVANKTYTFNMYDNGCNVFLVSVSFYIPGSNPPANNGYLTISKLVKNVTQNGNFAQTAVANSGDLVEYQITVTANNGSVNSVQLTDNLPSGINFVSGSLSVDGSNTGDNYSSINLGTLNSGQSKIVRFKAYATSQTGVAQTVLTNTATASGSASSVSSSATVYINQVINQGYAQLQIQKLVRTVGQGSNYNQGNYFCSNSSGFFQKSVNANNNDQVEFQIVVTNIGTQSVNSVNVSDNWNGSMNLVSGSVRTDCNSASDSLINGQLYIGDLAPGQSKRISFLANVTGSNGQTIQNTATARGNNVSQVSDTANVFVQGQVLGGNVNLTFSKKAVNETKTTSFGNPVDATTVAASREDFITYTLTVNNTGNTPANNFVITDDLSNVLQYADMADRGGANLNGNVLSYPAITIPAGGSVSKSFKVRIKFGLADNLSYTMTNTYGNTVSVRINNPAVKGAFVAPKTGADTTAFVFAGMLTAAFAVFRKKDLLMKLVLNS